MTKWTIRAAALAATLLFNVGLAMAGDCSCNDCSCGGSSSCGCCDSCHDSGCDCGCGGSSWIFDAEATFFRYHRADGVQNGNNPIDFGFEIAPRIALGYQNCGRGARVRYWEYDHRSENAGDSIDVATYTIDGEWFTNLQIFCDTRIEFSAGVRYVDFREILDFPVGGPILENTRFSGVGGLIGLQVNQAVWGGELYARARGSILMSDKGISSPETNLVDATQTIAELGLGYQVTYRLGNGSLLAARAGVEWQNWSDFSVEQNLSGDEGSDVGFGGFVVGAGLNY